MANHRFFVITDKDGTEFPGAMYSDGWMVDSRTGEPLKAANFKEISFEEWEVKFFGTEEVWL